MEELNGWVKIHRKILDNPIVCKDADTLAIWLYLILNATHQEYDVLFKGERITLREGQLITGILSIGKKLKIDKNKVQRTLKMFESEKQIEQQTSNRNRLISILNWEKYQQNDKQNDKQVINKRETSDKQVITNKNVKNIKNDKNNMLNEFNIYNNFAENVICDCIAKTTQSKCSRRSTYSINGKNYCNQHSKEVLQPFFEEIEKPTRKKTDEISKKEKVEEQKIHFAEFVSMTNADYEKLVSTYGKEFTNQCITVLDNYKGSKGKNYKSDYRAILSWVVDKVKEDSQRQSKKQPSSTGNPFFDLLREEGKM